MALQRQYTTIQLSQLHDGVCTLTFNRPHVKNAMNTTLFLEVIEALQSAASDPDICVLMLTGAGDGFTSGRDLKEPAKDYGHYTASPEYQFMRAIMAFPKPLVAAVNGLAVGLGVTLLPHCDFAYASARATFFTPFARVGLAPEFGSSVLFERRMGRTVANEMLVLGRKLTAVEAKGYGLVGEVFPDEGFEEAVRARCVAIRNATADPGLSARTLVLYKQIQRESHGDLNEVLHNEWRFLAARSASDDHRLARRLMKAKL
uniref:Enoyl-CoA hydratase n=1 Tax=Eutreptiella gymnastica TaxID=73025 RepID=A0A7S4CVF7_9EUGL